MNTNKIITKNLNFYYGDFQALKNINLNIISNKTTALIGPSGCGKSTYLKILNRMNDTVDNIKITGEVFLDGENIYHERVNIPFLRQKVGMVFQIPNPFPLSIYDNITYGLRNLKVKKSEFDNIVEKSLKEANLWDEVKDKLHQSALSLSGGQQQRLCIARALAIKPDVLLMDEPTSGLDPISTLKIEELVKKLSEKYTVVIVTHNMQQALRISDFTAFFLLGEIIEYGKTKDIFFKPQNIQTENYIKGRFG